MKTPLLLPPWLESVFLLPLLVGFYAPKGCSIPLHQFLPTMLIFEEAKIMLLSYDGKPHALTIMALQPSSFIHMLFKRNGLFLHCTIPLGLMIMGLWSNALECKC